MSVFCLKKYNQDNRSVVTAINNQGSMVHVNSLELMKFKKYIYEIGSRGNQLILYKGI
jgi:hypothetical protein